MGSRKLENVTLGISIVRGVENVTLFNRPINIVGGVENVTLCNRPNSTVGGVTYVTLRNRPIRLVRMFCTLTYNLLNRS